MTSARLDTIEIRGIRAWGHHGANAGEQDVAQPIDVDLAFDLDLSAARVSDELADTVSYADVHALVVAIVARERCALLERLGETILTALLRDPRIARARLTLAKPHLLAGATPVVTLQAGRP